LGYLYVQGNALGVDWHFVIAEYLNHGWSPSGSLCVCLANSYFRWDFKLSVSRSKLRLYRKQITIVYQ